MLVNVKLLTFAKCLEDLFSAEKKPLVSQLTPLVNQIGALKAGQSSGKTQKAIHPRLNQTTMAKSLGNNGRTPGKAFTYGVQKKADVYTGPRKDGVQNGQESGRPNQMRENHIVAANDSQTS